MSSRLSSLAFAGARCIIKGHGKRQSMHASETILHTGGEGMHHPARLGRRVRNASCSDALLEES